MYPNSGIKVYFCLYCLYLYDLLLFFVVIVVFTKLQLEVGRMFFNITSISEKQGAYDNEHENES